MQACLPDGLQAGDGPPGQCIWSAAPSFSLAFPTAPQMWAGARCGLYELFWQPAVPLPLASFPIAPQPSCDHHVLGGLQLGYLTKRLLASHREAPMPSHHGQEVRRCCLGGRQNQGCHGLKNVYNEKKSFLTTTSGQEVPSTKSLLLSRAQFCSS